jgi:hypothetical protein
MIPAFGPGECLAGQGTGVLHTPPLADLRPRVARQRLEHQQSISSFVGVLRRPHCGTNNPNNVSRADGAPTCRSPFPGPYFLKALRPCSPPGPSPRLCFLFRRIASSHAEHSILFMGIASGCRCRDGREKPVSTAICRRCRRPVPTAPAVYADALLWQVRCSGHRPSCQRCLWTSRPCVYGKPGAIQTVSTNVVTPHQRTDTSFQAPPPKTGNPREVVHWNSECLGIRPS